MKTPGVLGEWTGTLFGSPQAVTLDLRNWNDYDTTYHFTFETFYTHIPPYRLVRSSFAFFGQGR